MSKRPLTLRAAQRREVASTHSQALSRVLQERFRTVSQPRSPRCEWCRATYRSGRRGEPQRYCSARCRKQAWLATQALPPTHGTA